MCPCNLPDEFKVVGLELRVSGKSITNGDRITNYTDSNRNDIAISGPECIRFEITKIEKL